MELITIACLDMAGTTVADGGGVLAAFAAAIGRCGLAEGTPAHDQAMKTAQVTMGQSKIEVFRQIFTDEADAQRANAAFEECYAAAVAAGGVEAVPGAAEVMARLGEAGASGERAPIGKSEFEKGIGKSLDARLSYDPKSASAAANSGQPLPATAPRSAIVRELRQLTALLVGPAPAAAKSRIFALPSLW